MQPKNRHSEYSDAILCLKRPWLNRPGNKGKGAKERLPDDNPVPGTQQWLRRATADITNRAKA